MEMEILDRFVIDSMPLEPGITGVLARVNGELEIRTYYADGALRSRSLNGVGTQRWAELAVAAADLIGRANNVLWFAGEGREQDFERRARGLAAAVIEAFGTKPREAPKKDAGDAETEGIAPATPSHWHYHVEDDGPRGRPCTSSSCARSLRLGLLELATSGPAEESAAPVDPDLLTALKASAAIPPSRHRKSELIPDGDSPELPGVVDEDGGDRW